MEILGNLYKKNTICEYSCYGKTCPELEEKDIKELRSHTKFEIPEDYIVFLNELTKINEGKAIEINLGDGDDWAGPWGFNSYDETLWWITDDLQKSFLCSDDMMPIGDDMGSSVLYYGNGKEGFGIYVSSLLGMDYNDKFTCKLANSITELLVDGVGINILKDWPNNMHDR